MRISDWSSDVCSSDLLDQIGSAAGQLRLELVDLVITLAPFGLARETLDALDQHPAVPAPIEDGDFAVARQPLPAAPEEMARLFLVSRVADRPHLEIAQIGRAHVCTPVTHAHLVCRLLLAKNKQTPL